MDRRTFLSSGTVILGGLGISSIQTPVLAVDFELSEPNDTDLSNIDNILVKFTKFEITPLYINESLNPANISVDINLSGGFDTSETADFKVNLENGKTSKLVQNNILNDFAISVDSVSDDFIEGMVNINVSLGDFSDSYNQSFMISNAPDSTGGSVSTIMIDGSEYRIHKFELGMSDLTFSVTEDTTVDMLIVGGGGGGGGENSGIDSGGGGGGGGIVYKENYSVSANKSYDISIGDGGQGGDPNNDPNSEPVDGRRGDDTIFDVGGTELRAYGGGGGAYGGNSRDGPTYTNYGGGGGGASSDGPYGEGAPSTSQGNAGGRGSDANNPTAQDGNSDGLLAGGGGGGTRPPTWHEPGAGDGGDGGYYGDVFSDNYGENGYFAGGGGGTESIEEGSNWDHGSGGLGGGGNGQAGDGENGTSSTGGGGGAGDNDSFGGKGGSGIVLIRVGPI